MQEIIIMFNICNFIEMKIIHPSFTLMRCDFFSDCTIGVLLDQQGHAICKTLEPPFRLSNERRVMGKTAIAVGVYTLSKVYDPSLRYQNLQLGGTRSHLCFVTQDKATPNQTRGNILLGMHRNNEEGCLTDCVTAFEEVMLYYKRLRCNHQNPRIEVIAPGFSERSSNNFGLKPAPTSEAELPDYLLYTY